MECTARDAHEPVPLWTVIDTRGLHRIAPAEVKEVLIIPPEPDRAGPRWEWERGLMDRSVDAQGRECYWLTCPACPPRVRRPYPLTSAGLVKVLDAHYAEEEKAGRPVGAAGVVRLDVSRWRRALEALLVS